MASFEKKKLRLENNMNKLIGNAVVGQSGGPTAAINATLAGVIEGALASECIGTLYGMKNGIEGLLEDRLVDLSERFKGGEGLLYYGFWGNYRVERENQACGNDDRIGGFYGCPGRCVAFCVSGFCSKYQLFEDVILWKERFLR